MIRGALDDLGIELALEISLLLKFYPTFGDPRNHIHLGIVQQLD